MEVELSQLAQQIVIAQTPDWIAGTLLFPQDAKGHAQVLHDFGSRLDDFAPLRIVSSHAPEPKAVVLAAVVNGKFVLLNEFVPLTGSESEGVPVTLQVEKEFAA